MGFSLSQFVKAISFWGFASSIPEEPMQSFNLDVGLNNWLETAYTESITGLFNNIHPEGSVPGVVVASTSKSSPNYWYHWTRDSALVMDAVVDFYNSTYNYKTSKFYENILWDFAYLSKHLQSSENPSDQWGYRIGEAKFEVNGTAFQSVWGRPQNDGPAIRARTLMRFAEVYLAKTGDLNKIRKVIYDSNNIHTVVKRDLLYVAEHWNIPNFDLWEEVSAQNFYTRAAQFEALSYATEFSNKYFDGKDSDFYNISAGYLSKALSGHWDSHKGHILSNIDRNGGLGYKRELLDIETILASNHFDSKFSEHGSTSSKILSTCHKLIEAFYPLYDINKITVDRNNRKMAPGIGRYPEDEYDGYGTSLGNPWYLTTLAVSELFFRAIVEYDDSGFIVIDEINQNFFKHVLHVNVHSGLTINRDDELFSKILQALFELGDDFIRRVKYHTPTDFSLSEQFNRHTGYAQGAENLTWSYTSIITVKWRRDVADEVLSNYINE